MDKLIEQMEKSNKQLEEINRQLRWLLESRRLKAEFEKNEK